MKLSRKIWEYSEVYYNAMSNHQLIKQLKSGELPEESFKRFISQDILYLRIDSEAFKMASEKADNEFEQLFFDAVASNGVLYEQMMQDELMIDFDIQPAKRLETPFKEYCDHLIGSANSTYLDAISALLPCFWYYTELGKDINESHYVDNKYHKWLRTYSDPLFSGRVIQYVDIIDQIGTRVSDEEADSMVKSFRKSAEYELATFDYSLSLV